MRRKPEDEKEINRKGRNMRLAKENGGKSRKIRIFNGRGKKSGNKRFFGEKLTGRRKRAESHGKADKQREKGG